MSKHHFPAQNRKRTPPSRRNRGKRKLGFRLLVLFIAAISLILAGRSIAASSLFWNKGLPFPLVADQETVFSASLLPTPEGLHSQYAALEALDTGELLMDISGAKRAYPASLTKIMTAVVALDAFPDLDTTVTLSDRDFTGLYEENASMAGFQPNQEVYLRDLLYGLMLPSGAEAAAALANNSAGSQEAFVDAMNQKAQDLGMTGTHFTNATGLHDPNHYTTARDMALLLRTALQNPDFRDVFTAERHSTRETSTHPGITFYSTLFQAIESPDFPQGTLLGGKTGYTQEAGLCLASLAEKNGKEYILITMGAPGNHYTEPFHILDALKIYEELPA